MYTVAMIHTPTGWIQHLSRVEWNLLLTILHEYEEKTAETQFPQGFFSLLDKLQKVNKDVEEEVI